MGCLRLSLLMAAALATAPPAAHARIVILVDTAAQQMSVEVDGARRWTWPISSGRPGFRTPKGSYTAFRLERQHFSREWDDAPMPHSIFFTRRGHAIHGSYETKRLGRPVSHGCVRLHPANAATLFRLVESRGVTAASVIVK